MTATAGGCLRRSTSWALAWALAATVVLAPTAPRPAHAATSHPDPGIIRLQPVPGDVVPAGKVALTAVLFTSVGVEWAELKVDGVERAFRLHSLDGDNRRMVAEVEVGPGSHVGEISFRDFDGRSTRRLWRFAASDLVIHRLAGDDRVETAVAISQDGFDDDSTTAAVLATSQDFPDGLAAAPLATHAGGPLLLTAPDRLTAATAAELDRVLLPVATVYLLGGTSALSEQVAADVRELGYRVERLHGPDRAGTAAAVAASLPPADTVVVAAAGTYADALAAAAPAARDGWPILLAGKDALPAATREAVADRDPQRAVIVGGPAAVSEAVAEELRELVPSVDRVSGADRYETARAVADAFFGDVDTVALATGEGYADALAGGPHAGATGVPLVLTRPTRLVEPAADAVGAAQPGVTVLYGGAAALDPAIHVDLRRAHVNGTGGAKPVETIPAPGSTVPDVDTIEIAFDRGLDIEASSTYVTIDGIELYGAVGQGDFNDRLVFRAGGLPIDPKSGTTYEVQVTVLAWDGAEWRHVQWSYLYEKVDLGRGDDGASVRALQQRLTDLGYWMGTPDGNYGTLTSQAVMAFQKAEGLPRTGTADRETLDRLEVANRPRARATRSGRWVEIDKTRQIMLFVLDGQVQWAMNTSTGTETRYRRPDGSTGVAHTPEGWFTFSRQIDGMREAELGQMWRPKYFTSAGHAIHGSTSIPSYPASHGCARLSYPGIDFVWAAGLAPIGSQIYIYR